MPEDQETRQTGVPAPDANVAAADDESASYASDPQWRAILEGTDPGFVAGRGFFRRLPSSPRCRVMCGSVRRTKCAVHADDRPWTLGEEPEHLRPVLQAIGEGRAAASEIELSLLFADVRGSTGLAERMGPAAFRRLLDRFYHEATEILVAHDAVVDKFVGDEVVALFIPALAGAAHAQGAVDAGHDLLRATGHGTAGGPWIPIGVGIHTGPAYVGTVGDTVTDFTALGDSVNVAARLASAAGTGELLVSAVSAEAAGLHDAAETRHLTLRGRTEPMDVRVLRV